jgi:dipeptidyl aminopeptidase/acylaminoacyl peptidase
LALPVATQNEMIQCDVQFVRFDTFDKDPATGENRSLHGYLYTPTDQIEPKDRLVRMKSFYGGGNQFSIENQIFCEAGVVTFSPAVRGSWGLGKAFRQLNDGDLGGNEIVDLFHGARYLVGLGYDAKKIGVYGRSHGGYATMRAMTFPLGTNGHNTVFPFAFGMADAGFSDIIDFHANSNIPDWVLLEAGDPATEAEKLKDRSPIHHVDKLKAPLFFSHGENDNRVPVSGSRNMYEACIAAKQNCTFMAFPGQGHSIHGLANIQKLYQARFSFLEQIGTKTSPKP